ncbi:MAG: glycosyltransferase family 2 protein [Bacteroidaceae bacterium]|nr:glycosyltransferase family 2 protein [Bacteroidaceae bacterium]
MISVVINTYNAEQHLERVLQSVQGFDEVVVCDMESTDTTVAIAKAHGCRVVTFPKKDYVSAEPARTFAIQSATSPWVLVVDADELVPAALRDYLYMQIRRSDAPAGIYIPRKNYFMGRFMHCHYPDYLLRFFIREGTVWPPYVHTFPVVQGRLEKIPSFREDLAFDHLAHDSVADIVRKTNLYTENELEKKRGKHYGLIAFLWRPFFRWFKAYILKGGIRDGLPGFIRACLEGHYQFIMLAKMAEQRSKR